jgi:hypothetical protein
MRRSSKRPAGNAIGHAAIAATRVVIRKARRAVQSADRALYGAAPARKRATKSRLPSGEPKPATELRKHEASLALVLPAGRREDAPELAQASFFAGSKHAKA